MKSPDVVPTGLSETEALALMLEDPLMISEERRMVGFDLAEVKAWVGLDQQDTAMDLQTCTKSHSASQCKAPETHH